MGWRANMGVAEKKNILFNTYTQNTQNTQNPKEKTKKDNIADIADIAGKNQKVKKHKINLLTSLDRKAVKIEKMSICLHGQPCSNIYVVDNRQMCRRNNSPIFDLDDCPMGKWFTCGKISGDTKLETEKTIWCGTSCEHGQRRQIEGMPVLWCQVSDKAVIDLDRCLASHWIKDAEGRPYNVAR